MCFATITARRKIVNKDITVYKVFESDTESGATSPYMYHFYEFNKLYNSKIKTTKDKTFASELDKSFFMFKEKVRFYGKGFHSFLSIKTAIEDLEGYSNGHSIYECIIPKNSTYMVNEVGQLISEAIIVTNKKLIV